jgi:hypothetical protein
VRSREIHKENTMFPATSDHLEKGIPLVKMSNLIFSYSQSNTNPRGDLKLGKGGF